MSIGVIFVGPDQFQISMRMKNPPAGMSAELVDEKAVLTLEQVKLFLKSIINSRPQHNIWLGSVFLSNKLPQGEINFKKKTDNW